MAGHTSVGTGTRAATDTRSDSTDTAAPTVAKGARITGNARANLTADLKKRYEKGASIRALASATGRSYGFVHRLLVDDHVVLRHRGGATRGKRKA